MHKIFCKLNSLLLAIFLIFSNLNIVFASSTGNIVSSYVINKNLTSLDLSFIADTLRANLKEIPSYLKNQMANFQEYEENNIDLIKSGKYSTDLLFNGGSSGGGGATRIFYNNEYSQINEFKELVKDYNVRKSVDEDNLNKFISKKLIKDNNEFYKIYKKWNEKILNYFVINDEKDLSKYPKFTIKDIDFWYIKEDIEYLNFKESFKRTKLAWDNSLEIGNIEDPESGRRTMYSDRIMINSYEYRTNWEDENKFYESFKDKWNVESCWQPCKEAYLNFYEYVNQHSYIPGKKFMMFGSSDLNNPNENFSRNNVKMDMFYGTEWANLIVKYQKFLIKLPNGKFKISYIVDLDGNREYDVGDLDLSGRSRFTEYFPKIVSLKSDELYDYFTRYSFYDYDIDNGQSINININDIFIPYNANNLYNKDFINKLNNIDDLLYSLLTNLNYDKHFRRLNKRLDNYDALMLKFDDKLNFIIDKLNNFKLFDYEKLNNIIKDNLEEFNKKYIESLSKDLEYITNLVKENKIEILKNSDEIVKVYEKVTEIDSNIDNLDKNYKKISEDLEYIKRNLKSGNQHEIDNDFKSQFHDPEKNRVAESLNFFDKFINFFKDFFVVTEEFNFNKIDTSKISKKIPFSIFYDITSILKKLIVAPKVPKFDIPIYTETITVDFEKFESLAVIVRSFILLYVVILLVQKIYKR